MKCVSTCASSENMSVALASCCCSYSSSYCGVHDWCWCCLDCDSSSCCYGYDACHSCYYCGSSCTYHGTDSDFYSNSDSVSVSDSDSCKAITILTPSWTSQISCMWLPSRRQELGLLIFKFSFLEIKSPRSSKTSGVYHQVKGHETLMLMCTTVRNSIFLCSLCLTWVQGHEHVASQTWVCLYLT